MQKESQALQKIELRLHFMALRNALSAQRRLEAAQAIMAPIQNRGRTLSFFPIGSEINLSPLNIYLAKQGRLLLNRLEKGLLVPYFVEDLNQNLIISSLGILEPDPSFARKATLSEIDLILVPGVTFDRDGYRIGYGKGFYDRFLKNIPETPSIGVGFREQLSKNPLPRDAWDLPVKELLLV